MQHARARKKREGVVQGVAIERLRAEEIEIDRLAMPQTQCDGGAAVQGESQGGSGPEFGSDADLRRRQDAHAWLENTAHATLRDGKPEPLRPGMLVDADILGEQRKLYEWVLEPLYLVRGMGG